METHGSEDSADSKYLRWIIGIGTDITNPDWGTLLYQYRIYMTTYPRLVLYPTLFIAVLTVCLHATFDSSKLEKGEMTLYD